MLRIKHINIQLTDGSPIVIKDQPEFITLKDFCDMIAVEVFINRLQHHTGNAAKMELAQLETAEALGVHSKSTIYRILRRASH